MRKLSEHEIERIVSLLKEGKSLPEDYKSRLFDAKKEYELIYADKEREVDILADTMAVPLQKVKTFRNGDNGSGWKNKLIFGDNLQALKTLLQMKQENKLKNADGTSCVRLIYIDPPFSTRHEFKGSQDQKAYQDKIAGANFIEYLRKRLVFLRELLSDDGSIYIHLDWKKGHYVKAIMDEIFGEQNFVNEIIWHYYNIAPSSKVFFAKNHDVIFWYAKRKTQQIFNFETLRIPYEKGSAYAQRGWSEDSKYVPNPKGKLMDDVWRIPTINNMAIERIDYPTQKPEKLLDLIISASSNPGDVVLDCFAGSGTTLAAAEKLGRRWVGVDCGKLAIYTMQKRLLNIADSKDLGDLQKNKKYGKQCAPFTLYNAGLYDYKMIKELPWVQYRDFALKLFQCRDEKHEISKIEIDGYLGADNVLVFNYQVHKNAVMDRGFINDLHNYLGGKIGKRFFIIAPAASVQFLEDYIEKGKTKYIILRIPYSIIEEIHSRGFTKIMQPVNEMDVNDTVDAVGFDFIQVPTVECKYFVDSRKGQLNKEKHSAEYVIKIDKFDSKVISRKPLEFANLETLSMVMLDYDFNEEVFDLDEVFYAEELKKNGYEIRFAVDKVKKQIMAIYVDIFGNEKREIKTLFDFNGKRVK